MKKIVFGVFLVLSLGLSVPVSANSRYEKMKKQANRDELAMKIVEYNKQYPEEFEPIVDIAEYAFPDGDYVTGLSILKDAEQAYLKSEVFKKPKKHKDSLFYVGKMYCGFANCWYNMKDLNAAKKYIDKSYEIESFRIYNSCLKGIIDYELGNFDEAWMVFNDIYKKSPDSIYELANKYFMTLAAEKNDFSLAEKLLDRYLDNFPYYSGLGDFASDVYLKTGNGQKAVLCKFLELEYQSCFEEMSVEQFRRKMLGYLQKEGIKGNKDAEKTVLAVLSVYDEKIPLMELNVDFFAWDYLKLKAHVNRSEFHGEDIGKIMDIEKYLKNFPSFHWVHAENLKQIKNYRLYFYNLEKLISLGDSVYEKMARRILFESQMLLEEDFGRFLIPYEVDQSVKAFLVDSDEAKLDKVYSFLEIGDCSFMKDTLMILKNRCRDNTLLKGAFEKKLTSCSEGRLKNRLNELVAG